MVFRDFESADADADAPGRASYRPHRDLP